jgi:hypothetical protein
MGFPGRSPLVLGMKFAETMPEASLYVTTPNDDWRNRSWRNFSTVVLASGNAFF